MIPLDGEWSTIVNEYGKGPMAGSQFLMESKKTSRGDGKPTSKQVSSPEMNISKQVDKQKPPETTTFITEHETLNIPKLSKPIPAGLGILWNPSGGEHWQSWQNACTCCGDIGEHACEQTGGIMHPLRGKFNLPMHFWL
jgi:hypothetical protein